MKDKLLKLIPESRKLQACHAAIAALVLLGCLRRIEGQALALAIVGVVTAFMGGNSAEHFAPKDSPPPPQVPAP